MNLYKATKGSPVGQYVQRRRVINRYGIACVEFAVLAPVIVVISMAIIDICNVLHLKQKLNSIAFETSRVASYSDETFESAIAAGNEFAKARQIVNCSILVEANQPENFSTRASLPLGHWLKSRATAPVQGNVPGPFILFGGNASVQSQLVKLAAR